MNKALNDWRQAQPTTDLQLAAAIRERPDLAPALLRDWKELPACQESKGTRRIRAALARLEARRGK